MAVAIVVLTLIVIALAVTQAWLITAYRRLFNRHQQVMCEFAHLTSVVGIEPSNDEMTMLYDGGAELLPYANWTGDQRGAAP